ncbi:MAG TPA: MFS transporter [Macromonas sp.]|nr:MFS transporter [Macromonas sp.]
MADHSSPNPSLSMTQLLVCGAAVLTLSMGVRHGFGLWLQPVIQTQGWQREDFALAIAVQNLAWGFFGIFSGMVADRFGAFRVLLVGTVLYALGLVGMALSPSVLVFVLTAGVLLGAAQSATTYTVIYGVLGRQLPPEKRAWAMGVTGAAGSFGQFLMVPTSGLLIGEFGWREALLGLAAASLLMAPLALGLREPGLHNRQATPQQRHLSIGQALREAVTHRSFQLLMLAYFVCGFQVVFMGVHLPSYLRDQGQTPQVASMALALIGLFNIFGTYGVGVLSQKVPKRHLLAAIYFLRSVAIVLLLSFPVTPWSTYLFACGMGLLWLSTVPVTNAVVAQIYGVQHLSMLAGFVFFSHQIGSFMGVWLGGRLFDATGSYDIVWQLSIGLGVAAAVLSVVLNENPIQPPQRTSTSGVPA